jgi:regulator of RNase E activity RraA
MNFASTDRTKRIVTAAILLGFLSLCSPLSAQDRPGSVAASKAELAAGSTQWKGERYPDGRPKVPDEILERMKNVSTEEAWEVLRAHKYDYQFDSGWTMLRPDEPFVGRALTVAYLPSRPDFDEQIISGGRAEGRVGRPNSWPIDMLQKGDVYVADGMGKIADGTLIGDNLGNAIYAKTGTGVVFNASARDPEGLEKIKGFNAFVRGWDPSEIKGVTLSSINRPIRIGRAVVLPGDVVLARKEGVIFIPAQLAEEVVVTSEIVSLKDEFGHMRLREGKYKPGQIDSKWSDEIKADFYKWLDAKPTKPKVTRAEIEKQL